MRWRPAIVAALALSLSCAPADAPDPAAATALRVFELARAADPDPATVDALFGQDADADRRAALYDALALLGDATGVRVVASEPLEGLSVTAVDLVADLRGGGQADVSVQLRPAEDGAWRVTWIAGPGFGWPPRDGGRGTGLTVSPPPGADPRAVE